MKKPVVIAVMDNTGESSEELSNIVMKATIPTLDALKANDPFRIIKAHDTVIGFLSDDDMDHAKLVVQRTACGRFPLLSMIRMSGMRWTQRAPSAWPTSHPRWWSCLD